MWSLKGVKCWLHFESQQSLLRVYACVFLNKLTGYENFTDGLEICFKDSLVTNLKNRVRENSFSSKLISRNGLRRNEYRQDFNRQF